MELIAEQNPADDIQELVWAMLDEQISAEDLERLETRLCGDEEARKIYLQCVQLHVDFRVWFETMEQGRSTSPGGLPMHSLMPDFDQSLADPTL